MITDAIVLWVVCAVTAGMISDRKNNGFLNGLVIGVLLNFFGVIIVMCLKTARRHRPPVQLPGLPKAPAGLVAVKCPRCNTVQNVPTGQPQFECWQCKHVEAVSK